MRFLPLSTQVQCSSSSMIHTRIPSQPYVSFDGMWMSYLIPEVKTNMDDSITRVRIRPVYKAKTNSSLNNATGYIVGAFPPSGTYVRVILDDATLWRWPQVQIASYHLEVIADPTPIGTMTMDELLGGLP